MELNEFLVKAKKNTYAGEGEGGEKILEDGSKELVYEEENYSYRDRYFGFDPFSGEEIVWEGKEIIWSMNYYGKTTSDDVPSKKIYKFLQKALREIQKNRPFRGLAVFREGNMEYRDESQGDVSFFKGKETIIYKGKEIYFLEYHGGFIKPKSELGENL